MLSQVLDGSLATDESTLECFPGKRGRQDVECSQDEETTIGSLECPWPDLAEIGDQGTEGRTVVDAPNQVVVGRIAFDDDRVKASE